MTEQTTPTSETVSMDDGRVVEFPNKRKMQKETIISPDGAQIQVRCDFRNGETRTFTVPETLKARFAAHGAAQKLGDEIAGLKGKDGKEADIEDIVYAIDELMDRLAKGEWTTASGGQGMAGVSVLAKALAEVKGVSIEKVKEFLKSKTQAEKMALRANPVVKPVVDRIEAEKASRSTGKAASVDSNAMLEDPLIN